MARYTATVRYLRQTPRKTRSVSDLIRGLSVNEAEAQLLLVRRRAAKAILKLLHSAMANAKQMGAAPEMLTIESIRVDQGPMLKRSLPRARGSASPIQKKMCHITIILSDAMKPKAPRFTIVMRKKAKKAQEAGKKPRKEKPAKEEEGKAEKPKRPGFMKRMFSPKSRFAK